MYNPKRLPCPVVALRQISRVPLISTTQWNDSEALPLRQQYPYSGLRECDEYTLAAIRKRRGGFGPCEDLYSKARTSPELICPLKNIEPEFTLRIQVSTDETSIIVCFAPIPDQHRLLALKEPCEFSLCKQEIDIAMVGDLWKDFREIPRILFPVPPKKTKQQEKRETVYRRTAAK